MDETHEPGQIPQSGVNEGIFKAGDSEQIPAHGRGQSTCRWSRRGSSGWIPTCRQGRKLIRAIRFLIDRTIPIGMWGESDQQ